MKHNVYKRHSTYVKLNPLCGRLNGTIPKYLDWAVVDGVYSLVTSVLYYMNMNIYLDK